MSTAAEPRGALPHIVVIATGGTIAGASHESTDTTGYHIGSTPVAELIAAVPELAHLATVTTDQPFNLDSKDFTPGHWLALARTAQAHLDNPAVDAVVITHGTDTLEETAFFLHLTLVTAKPVVMTAAMRPASALSADGPMNLYQAVAVAVTPAAAGVGVLVVAADRIYGARSVTKRHTQAADALGVIEGGPVGWANPPRFTFAPVDLSRGALPLARLAGLDRLPEVEIVYVAAGSNPALLLAACAAGAAGIVLALPGNGSLPDRWEAALQSAAASGVVVVRGSRTGGGPVSRAAEDVAGRRVSAGWLSPVKARVVLVLALAVGDMPMFESLSG